MLGMHFNTMPSPDDLLHRQVENWWRTDACGTKNRKETPRSCEDKRAIEILEKTVCHFGERYEAGLLWKDEDVSSPDNRSMAERRHKSTERGLKKDETLAKKYCAIIEDSIERVNCRSRRLPNIHLEHGSFRITRSRIPTSPER